ncbi:hypothetical protein [Rhodoferax sp. WC2427]|uniref:hypothetical protein n=1 Tax=Rhodoferax sp. WC2427 TaxID=3234144 RepID=UPI003465AD1F
MDASVFKQTVEMLFQNNQQIHENIKFADQKAGAVITANTALLALIYSTIPSGAVLCKLWTGFLVCFILAVAIALAFFAIKPRGSRNLRRGPGVVDSIRINLYGLRDYLDRAATISEDDFLCELRTLIHDRSHIDERKYFYLRASLGVSALGWLAALVFAAWVKLQT